MMTLLAQGGPAVPWSDTSKWILGALGFLGSIWLVFAVVIQVKRLFGKNPPIAEELNQRDKALRKMIFVAEKTQNEKRDALEVTLRTELRLMHGDQERRIAMLEEQHVEMQNDRLRKWEEMTNAIGGLSSSLAFIRGKFERKES